MIKSAPKTLTVAFFAVTFTVTLAIFFGLSGAPARAQDVPTLDIYTYDGFAAEWGPGIKLSQGFEAICGGCAINWIAADSSIGALRRVQLEGASSPADLVLGLDSAIAGQARATGLFIEHGLDFPHLSLPDAWTDPHFVPFDFSHFAFVYDSDTLATPPRSFEELIALPDSFKIVVQDPRSATPGLGLVLWIKAAYGDEADDIWAGLKPHILTVTRGWSEAYALFLDGEADMALSYTTSPAYHIVADGDPSIKAALFAEGHYAQIEVAGILKSSHEQDLAKKFLAWLTTPEAQKIIPTTNWMFPVADLGPDLEPAFTTLPQPAKTLKLEDAEILAKTPEWIEEMLSVVQ